MEEQGRAAEEGDADPGRLADTQVVEDLVGVEDVVVRRARVGEDGVVRVAPVVMVSNGTTAKQTIRASNPKPCHRNKRKGCRVPLWLVRVAGDSHTFTHCAAKGTHPPTHTHIYAHKHKHRRANTHTHSPVVRRPAPHRYRHGRGGATRLRSHLKSTPPSKMMRIARW